MIFWSRLGFTPIALVAACILSSCDEDRARQDVADPQFEKPAVLTLDWGDLMPEGEEEHLQDLYNEFYLDLSRRMSANQVLLSEAGEMLDSIEEGSRLDAMPQLGTFSTVPDLDGRRVRLPGFVVPLDFETKGRLKNFLFVPYFGACIHTPPPPPNQIIYIEGEASLKIDDIWMPFWVEGELRTETARSEMGDAAYTLYLEGINPYEE